MPNYYDHFSASSPFTASQINLELDKIDLVLYNITTGEQALTKVNFAAATELTIASGVVTATQSWHTIDTEGDASTDDLTDINGGEIGDELFISANNGARDVVVKHDVTKIALADAADLTLNETWKIIHLIKQTSTLWVEVKSASAISAPSYVKVSDVKAKGTNGGTNSAGWQVRTLNTEDSDAEGICTLSSSQITLAAGTYTCYIRVPADAVNYHKAVLWNATDSSLVLVGSSIYAGGSGNVNNDSIITGRFTIEASKALEVRHYTGTSVTTYGLGVAVTLNDPGGAALVEVYTTAEFRKVG